ncbi:MAG TPA: lamin tail domain-containing protein [Pyrinomonadaceae bacterium]|nr:lamin tail domain-containing protein [Pyrinomonadaceae bacterium]
MSTSPTNGRQTASARRKRSVAATLAFIVLPLVGLAAVVVGPGAGYAPTSAAPSTSIVISQVYPGGGASTGSPTYKNDYVELFNLTSSPISLTGFSLQYGSSTGNFGSSSTNIYAFPAGTTIAANK